MSRCSPFFLFLRIREYGTIRFVGFSVRCEVPYVCWVRGSRDVYGWFFAVCSSNGWDSLLAPLGLLLWYIEKYDQYTDRRTFVCLWFSMFCLFMGRRLMPGTEWVERFAHSTRDIFWIYWKRDRFQFKSITCMKVIWSPRACGCGIACHPQNTMTQPNKSRNFCTFITIRHHPFGRSSTQEPPTTWIARRI